MTITITDGSTNHTVTGLQENTEYHFTVIAEADSSTDRGESNTITATTGKRCIIIPLCYFCKISYVVICHYSVSFRAPCSDLSEWIHQLFGTGGKPQLVIILLIFANII